MEKSEKTNMKIRHFAMLHTQASSCWRKNITTTLTLKNLPFNDEKWPLKSDLPKAGVVKPSIVIKVQEQKNHQNLSENRIPNAN